MTEPNRSIDIEAWTYPVDMQTASPDESPPAVFSSSKGWLIQLVLVSLSAAYPNYGEFVLHAITAPIFSKKVNKSLVSFFYA